MAVRIELTPLPTFDLVSEPSFIGQMWKMWKTWTKKFKTHLIAMNIGQCRTSRATY